MKYFPNQVKKKLTHYRTVLYLLIYFNHFSLILFQIIYIFKNVFRLNLYTNVTFIIIFIYEVKN